MRKWRLDQQLLSAMLRKVDAAVRCRGLRQIETVVIATRLPDRGTEGIVNAFMSTGQISVSVCGESRAPAFCRQDWRITRSIAH